MKKELISQLHESFENHARHDNGVEFWHARDLQSLLGYSRWENFEHVLEKARESCQGAGTDPADHFLPITTVVESNDGAKREVDDFKLTRYACYLSAQNGDPRKEEIAFAQTYFAIQTRKAEIVGERLRELRRIDERENLSQAERRFAGIAFERGVDSEGFAQIKSRGDRVLFGGLSTREMKRRLHVSESQPLADVLPTVAIAAKAFADALTEQKVVEKDIRDPGPIAMEHELSNEAVRAALLKRGVRPETLPAADEIRKPETRRATKRKKIANS